MRQLLREQFPQWAGHDVRAVEPDGWDHRSFRIGDELVARLPSAIEYSPQVEAEHRWLPRLAPHLPLAVPVPLAMGEPGPRYPWRWSIRKWIPGETPCARTEETARGLARFLASLQSIDASGGPAPGARNFHRGGDLQVYDGEVRRALAILGGRIPRKAAMAVWEAAVASRWSRRPVWIHGDIAPGNLIGQPDLAAVIDFGNLAVGDPACDLAIAWTWLDDGGRRALRSGLALDPGTWLRARAWALWKGLIVAADMSRTNGIEWARPLEVVERCLRE